MKIGLLILLLVIFKFVTFCYSVVTILLLMLEIKMKKITTDFLIKHK